MFLAMLDMGQRKYGDMTFCKVGQKTFLVDGAHFGDERTVAEQDRVGSWEPIPEQLETLYGHAGPFEIDLLIVTHCHSDHIGCLPELVASGKIKPKWALLADPRMGFGLPLDQPFPNTPKGAQERVTAALREEPLPESASNEEVRLLIDAAATLQDRYHEMIIRLKADGAQVVRYGRDPHLLLEKEFADTGFKILGPTVDQLLICALRVEKERLKADQHMSGALLSDGGDEVSLYRALVKPMYREEGFSTDDGLCDNGLLEDGGTGAALNNQSIVVKIGHAPAAVLLTGDMQFASPSVGHLAQKMLELHTVIRNAGPFAFTRLAHHGAANGTDARFLDYLPDCQLFGISTGASDAKHPSSKVLDLLANRDPELEWARTDRNGLVKLTLDGEDHDWFISRGNLSESDANVTTKAKPRSRRKRGASPVAATGAIGASDRVPLPRLTFVTNVRKLSQRIGEQALAFPDAITGRGHGFVDFCEDLSPQDVAQMAKGSRGLVILGGYGVVPGVSVDTIPGDVRRELDGRSVDGDNYVVWSDDPYGTVDGFAVPDIAVSRIPDDLLAGGVTELFESCAPASGVFGLRNRNRPFASSIFSSISAGAMMESEPTAHSDLSHQMLDVGHVYLMLHGFHEDASVFSGESLESGEDEVVAILSDAFTIANIPEICAATVFAGCCYGAQIVRDKADGWIGGEFDEIATSDSIALSFLRAGAKAFVGSTGVHYSPGDPPYETASGPMHRLFWENIKSGLSPAEALREAKLSYFSIMPFDEVDAKQAAAELKTLRQFTCLGLGW